MSNMLYSYQDCWNHALSAKKTSNCEQIKHDLISICQTSSVEFWSKFTKKSLIESNYLQICQNIDKYLDQNYPVPYLINQVSFYGLSFYIEKGVFIPQKDTEILVEKVLELVDKYWKDKKIKVLDIGTGCGNIVISLAKYQPNWSLTAVDINEKTLGVAKNNAELCQVENIQFIQSDLFSNVEKNEKFDIIVSNPPYISNDEYEKLAPIVKEQPKEALVAANDGYFFYQEIFRSVGNFLAKKFLLIVEIGYQQEEKVVKLIIEYFPQAKVSIFSDYQDRSRVIAITNNN